MVKTMPQHGKPYVRPMPGYLVRIHNPDGTTELQPTVSGRSNKHTRDVNTLLRLANEGRVPIRNIYLSPEPKKTSASPGASAPPAERSTRPVVQTPEKPPSAKKASRWLNPHVSPSGSSTAPKPAKSPLPQANIEDDFDLASSDVVLPGERTARIPQTSGSPPPIAEDAQLASTEDEQTAELYRQGILYDDEKAVPAGNKPKDADELDKQEAGVMVEAEAQPDVPSYTVRYVAIKRKGGKRMAVAIARPRPPTPQPAGEAGGAKGKGRADAPSHGAREAWPPLGGRVRLFAVPGLLGGNEVTLDDIRGEDNAGIREQDLEDLEYVLLDNDDVASLAGSMAGSWIELDSTADSDDAPSP